MINLTKLTNQLAAVDQQIVGCCSPLAAPDPNCPSTRVFFQRAEGFVGVDWITVPSAQQQTNANANTVVQAHDGTPTTQDKADASALPNRVIAALAIVNSTSIGNRSGTLTNGSAVVTGLPKTSDLTVGMVVAGTGVAAGSKIQSIDSASQVTLTANATASGTNALAFVCATPAQKAVAQGWLDQLAIAVLNQIGL